jgi:hypothetical protein
MRLWLLFAFSSSSCWAFAGCGGSHDLPLVPVSGTVTFEGGPAPAPGTLSFSQSPGSGVPGLPSRPGRASFDADGKFAVTTFQEGDGLLPGTYRVTIVCLDGEPGGARPREMITFIPLDYRPDDLVIEEGQDSVVVNYDVPLNPKKKK